MRKQLEVSCGNGTSQLYVRTGAGVDDFWNVNKDGTQKQEADLMAWWLRLVVRVSALGALFRI